MRYKLRAPLILASASQRRQSLLSQAGYEFEIKTTDLNEETFFKPGINPIEYTKLLAHQKALPVARANPRAIVLGSDTVVYAQGQIIGKPRDEHHAREIVEMLFSTVHEVITGLALLKVDEGISLIEHAITIVYPKKLTMAQIEEHIQSGNWQGKAGAYGIQEAGDEFIEKIDGSFTNVMGFPMELVIELLHNFKLRQ